MSIQITILWLYVLTVLVKILILLSFEGKNIKLPIPLFHPGLRMLTAFKQPYENDFSFSFNSHGTVVGERMRGMLLKGI